VIHGYGMVLRPGPNIFKVTAGVQRAKVGPVVIVCVSVFWIQSEGEYTNVALAHEVQSQSLNAVV
jgi:hypothetical protein